MVFHRFITDLSVETFHACCSDLGLDTRDMVEAIQGGTVLETPTQTSPCALL
jgi:hypothetical protein